MKATLFGSGLIWAVPSFVYAHPGHAGPAGIGWVHYLTNPYHLALGMAAALCVVLAGRIVSVALSSRLERIGS